MRRVAPLYLTLVALAAGCGGSAKDATPTTYVRPIGAYVAPSCSSASEQRSPQYVAVSGWVKGRITGNAGRFAVPECANVIVYVDSDRADELRVPALRIAAKVLPGKPAKLEFYAPAGTYPVRLHRNKIELLRVVVEKG
jgi:hypothetical protein